MAEPSKSIDSSGMDEFGYAQTPAGPRLLRRS